MNASSALLFSATITGKTPGKARPRYDSRNRRHHMPQPYLDWMEHAERELRRQTPPFRTAYTTPVCVSIQVILPAPKSKPAKTSPARRSLWFTRTQRPSEPFPWMGKPDIDNAAGSVLDALVKADILADDTLVGELRASLWASHAPEWVGVALEIHSLAGRWEVA